jgi:hypothetical protein
MCTWWVLAHVLSVDTLEGSRWKLALTLLQTGGRPWPCVDSTHTRIPRPRRRAGACTSRSTARSTRHRSQGQHTIACSMSPSAILKTLEGSSHRCATRTSGSPQLLRNPAWSMSSCTVTEWLRCSRRQRADRVNSPGVEAIVHRAIASTAAGVIPPVGAEATIQTGG